MLVTKANVTGLVDRKVVVTMIFIMLVLANMIRCESEKAVKLFNEEDGLVVQGMIEAKEISINSKIPGKISKIYVEEGADVNVESLLVEMTSDEIKAKEKQAKRSKKLD
ncbi:HlyD family secretion protein [Marinisporobacter balticus]|uniref:Biotin/lipoyl-binding protein n=1 Tax=Marinisporobacter balticus TaxID=2018667 RepID=A0A4R2LHB7_9FIRM|nr:biotin/lipoyl-binding protein [Marinisporobacter balticus]TCO78725.1 biotin/lipoyl-binding protein [Marinisporobacter balticus]